MCAQVVIRSAYQRDRSEGIGGQLSFDKGHVFDEFFAVAAADEGLETEEMVGAEMQDGSSVVHCGFLS